jgi:hypothetical protein
MQNVKEEKDRAYFVGETISYGPIRLPAVSAMRTGGS